MIHVNEIKFEGEDNWTKQFNKCSDLWAISNNETLPEEERLAAQEEWMSERQRLEMGMY